MKRLIDGSPLGDADRKVALGYIENRVDLETGDLGRLSAEARLGIYRAAVKLAKLDRHVAESETALLTRLRDGLKIDAAAAQRIEAET